MSKVDFKNCYDKVKQAYGIQGDLIITVADKKNTNNPASYYSFFHPTTGKKLNAESICREETIVVKENLTSILNENDTKFELQTSLANQGINIFDVNDPFYTDLCFDFENKGKTVLQIWIGAIANIKAYTGAAMGDPLGMPDYLPRMTFAAFFIAGFVQAYVHLASIFPLYYAFGSANTIELERNKMKI